MKPQPSTEPTPQRVKAWIELSELFAGRELDPSDFHLMARRLHETGLPLPEIERTLWADVEPVFGGNIGLWNPTPEMEGWSAQAVEAAVRGYLQRPHGPLKATLHRWLTPRAVRRISHDRWARLRDALLDLGESVGSK